MQSAPTRTEGVPQVTTRQGYLAHKKQRPPRTLKQDYAWGPMVVLGEIAVCYERGTPVNLKPHPPATPADALALNPNLLSEILGGDAGGARGRLPRERAHESPTPNKKQQSNRART